MQKLEVAYEKAKLNAEDETGIDKGHFPEKCPFSLEDIFARNFFPSGDDSI